MKIEKITLTGFGAYKEETKIDFGQYSDAGLFLITGRTGAGKTTLLDAVTYALYGSIPSADSKGGDKARSHFCTPTDPTWVELEFTDNGERYLVFRSPRYMRAKTRGTGETEQQEAAHLSIWRDGAWEVLAETQVRKVAEKLDGIIKLSAEQFRQVILLAQGQFQEFLVANSEDRQRLLRTLFDSRRFEEYHAVLKEQRDALRTGLAQTRTAVSTLADGLASRHEAPEGLDTESATAVLAWLAPVLIEAASDLEAATSAERNAVAASTTADQVLTRARDVETRQKRRDAARDKVAVLQEEIPEIDRDRSRLAAGRRAAVAWTSVVEVRTAQTKVEAALTGVGEAESKYVTQHDGDVPDSLDTIIEKLSQGLGALSTAVQQEESLPTLASRVSDATRAVEQHAEAEADRAAQVVEMETTLKAHRVRILELEPQAQEVAGATVAHGQATQCHQAAVEAAQLADALDGARDEQVKAERHAAQALTSLTDLRVRQRQGFAGALASELADGSPCGVCGSATHPAPADSSEQVTDLEIETAEADEKKARRTLDAANALVLTLETQHREKDERAGGTVEETLLALESASSFLTGAHALARELVTEREALEKVRLHLDELTKEGSVSAGRTAELAAARTAAGKAHHETLATVVEARAGHPTVALRLALLRDQLASARHLDVARRTHTDASAQLTHCTSVMQKALVSHDFVDADDVERARVPDAELQTLEQRVTAHDVAFATARETLASPDMRDLPEEPVDLDEPTRICDEARVTRDDAVAARVRAGGVHGQLLADQAALETHRAAGAEKLEQYEVLNQLTETINGAGSNTQKMKLEAFVLAAELERVLEAANQRLGSMTSGRYELQHCEKAGRSTSGLNIEVLDAHTGGARHPKSLSGGEKFQASLALALGLADVVTSDAGGLQLESLFIDEGFGSLDSETLETTMATLDSLREGGRTVGLISHVDSLKERIPAQLLVEVAPDGWSVARQE